MAANTVKSCILPKGKLNPALLTCTGRCSEVQWGIKDTELLKEHQQTLRNICNRFLFHVDSYYNFTGIKSR